jgi:hypothetical protein
VAGVAMLPFTTTRNDVRSFFVCLEIDCPARSVERSSKGGRSRFDFASHWDRRCKRPAKVVGGSDDTVFSDSAYEAPPRLTLAPMRPPSGSPPDRGVPVDSDWRRRACCFRGYFARDQISSAPVNSAEAAKGTEVVQPKLSPLTNSTVPLCVEPRQLASELCSTRNVRVFPASSSV